MTRNSGIARVFGEARWTAAVAAGVLGMAARVLGQTPDYTHRAPSGFGQQESDFTRGVAMWHDGTYASASEVYTAASGFPVTRRAEIVFVNPNIGQLGFTMAMQPVNTQSASAAMAIASGVPDVEGPSVNPGMYVTGWYEGTVLAPNLTQLCGGSFRRTFVSRLYRTSGFNTNSWNTSFVGLEGPNEGLCVAASPPCCIINGGVTNSMTGGISQSQFGGGSGAMAAAGIPPPGPAACPGCFVAVGGYYTGGTYFGLCSPTNVLMQPIGPSSGQDAYVAVLVQQAGYIDGPEDMLVFGGTGPDRVTGIAIDQHTNDVIVTGSFTGGDIDFDPHPTNIVGPLPGTFPGGTNIFVARYRFVHDPPPAGTIKLALYWRWTFGTSGDDSGTAVALDSAGDVYVTGYKADALGNGDLWVAKLLGNPSLAINTSVLWQHNWTGDGDDRGHGIVIDGLDRVVVTGQFGKPRVGDSVPVYCLDFNPSPTVTDSHCTAGGLDVFTTRFRPDGSYDWTFTLGGNYNDVGSSIAIDPAATGDLTHGGSFGGPDAPPSAYTVDFDPGAATYNLTSVGKEDGFVNNFGPTPPTGVAAAVSLVMDNSSSVDGPGAGSDYTLLMNALQAQLTNTAVVPQNGSVAVNAVNYGLLGYAGQAVPVMPWTVMNATTAPLFVQRLARQRRLVPGGNVMGDGLVVATNSLVLSQMSTGAYATALVIGDETQEPLGTPVATGRAYALDIGRFDRISAYAVLEDPGAYTITRQWCVDNLIGSRIGSNPIVSGDASIGFAGEPSTVGSTLGFQHPDFAGILERMLLRVTFCPSDYNRSGDYNPVVDRPAFLQSSALQIPYADWNFDGAWDGHLGGIDLTKFDAGAAVVCP